MENTIKNIRVFFSKTGRAVYISHLDLYRVFQRAIKRCKLPVWETQGFNPHIYLTFALPLALGTAGVCESMDTRLTQDLTFEEVRDRLNNALPADIRILSAAQPKYDAKEIASSLYEACYELDEEKYGEFLAQPQILAEKKTKRGMTQLDIKEHIAVKRRESGFMEFTLPSGSDLNINAGLLFEAFEKYSGEEIGILNIKRTAVYCKNGEIFI